MAGVDTSDLTAQEKRLFSELAERLAAPCPDRPSSLATCVQTHACAVCASAAALVKEQVRRGKLADQVRAAYDARFAPERVHELQLGDSPSLGSADAPVTIVEWADFECGYCGRASAVLHHVLEKHPGQVRLVFKHFPLSSHPDAEFAAKAAIAAQAQGKFWALHDRLFETQRVGLDETRIRAHARELGLDMALFDAALTNQATAAMLAADKRQAVRLGLRGTPMVYISGRFFDQAHFDLTQDIDEWIRAEIELSKTTGTGIASGGRP